MSDSNTKMYVLITPPSTEELMLYDVSSRSSLLTDITDLSCIIETIDMGTQTLITYRNGTCGVMEFHICVE